mgnify:CR=1 FL=1
MKIGKRPARILLYEQVVEDLCLLIDRGDFEPGDQLPSERELIEKLNVSRNVLREAFHVLESRGVIVSHQGKGRFLRESPISGKEKRYDSLSKNLECYSMIEAYEVRQALEEKAVELIIKNASEKDIDELEEALQHLRKKYEETGRTSGEFELHRLYAAKTGSDGVHRYVYGWNPTREVNEHNFDPPGYPGKDCNTWDWGGSLVVHELWQDENGDLFVKPIPQVLEAVGREEPLQMQALTGEWKLEKDQAKVDTPYDFSALLLNPVGETSRLSFDVEVAGDNPSIGIAVHVGETFTVGYYLLIDFGRRRIEFKSGVRMTERGGQMFPYEVELERPLPMSTGKSFHVDVIADGTILEAYVDGKIALGTRMYDQTGGCFGLYASDGKAVFRDIKVFHA